MEKEKQCWIPTGTGNTVVLCVLWSLHVEDQDGVARAQKENAHRQTVVGMSFGKRDRRGAPCQGGRLEGCSKFPLLPHSPISYSPFFPSPTPSWDTSPALTATKIWQSGNLLLPFPPPFWACLGHTPRPGPTGCTLGSRDHTQTGLAPHELCLQEPHKASSGRRDLPISVKAFGCRVIVQSRASEAYLQISAMGLRSKPIRRQWPHTVLSLHCA